MNDREELEKIDEYLETGFLGGEKKVVLEEDEALRWHKAFHDVDKMPGCKYCEAEEELE